MKQWSESDSLSKAAKGMTQLGGGYAKKWLCWHRGGGHWGSIILRHVWPQGENDDGERERMRL